MIDRPPTYYLFISHVHEEALIARELKRWFEATFPAGLIAAFVSSDYEDNPLGKKWLDIIDAAMGQARLVITLLSPRSMPRMWIHLETGWARGRNVDILPICHSGMKVDGLPKPYSDYSGTQVDLDDFAPRLLATLKSRIGLSHEIPNELMQAFAKVIREKCALVAATVDQAKPAETAATAKASSSELEDAHHQILIGLSTVHGSSNDEVDVNELASALKVSPAKASALARRLEEVGFVRRSWGVYGERLYKITDRGLAYLDQHGLL
jgi:DNA-binding MarR family transcriptional regulator